MSQVPALFSGLDAAFDHGFGHILYVGASGTGKSQGLIAQARKRTRNPLSGLVVVDPEGEIAPACRDYLANPVNGLGWRTTHYLKPSSPAHTFSLPILHVPDRDPAICHAKAVRAKEIFQQAVTVGAGDYGPRLSKLFYLGSVGLALSGRPLIDMAALFARGATHLREIVAAHLPYAFMADEFASLDLLNDKMFLEYRDPLISRLMPIFGNPVLRRVFGPQPPVDIARILRNREIALLDLSGLEHADAVLVGKAFFNLVYHEALQREPNREPHAMVMVDEAFDYLTADMARGFDRLRKRNIQLCLAIQRLAQASRRSDEDTVGTLSAVIANTRTKVVFRMADPDDAEYMARVLFSGYVPLNEWKSGTERPVAVGQHKETVRNRSSAEHRAQHQATSEVESVAYGSATTRMTSVTEAESESETETMSEATALGTITAEGFASGISSFEATSSSESMDPFSGGILTPFTIIGLGAGTSSGSGSTEVTTSSSATSSSSMRGSSYATTRGRSTAVTEGAATTESEVHGRATGHSHGSSTGSSDSAGQAETFVTTYEWMPSQLYSLQEQLHRLAGEIQTLGLRECFVRLDNARPVRTRTADLAPAFKSDYFRRIMVPLFEAKLAESPYLLPIAEADALIAARDPAKQLPALPPPDTSPEPFIVDDPVKFAEAFWDKRKPEPDPTKPPKSPRPPRGRRPLGELPPQADKFRVIDGDGDKPKGRK